MALEVRYNTPKRLQEITEIPHWMRRSPFDGDVELTKVGWVFKPTGEVLMARRREPEEVTYWENINDDVPQGSLSLSVDSEGTNSVDLKVEYDNLGVDAIEYEYRVDGGDPKKVMFEDIDETTILTVDGLSSDTTYSEGHIEVRAVNKSGEASWVESPEFKTKAS